MRGASTIVHRPDITAMISAAFEPAGSDSDSWEGSEDSDAEFSDDDIAAQLAGLRLDGTPGRKGSARTPAKAANGNFRGSATPPSTVPLIVQQGMRRGKSSVSTPATPASKAAKQEQKKAEKKARKEAAAQEQKARRAASKLAKAEKKLAAKSVTSKSAAAPATVAAAAATPSPAGAKRAGPAPLTPTQVITAKGKGKAKKT